MMQMRDWIAGAVGLVIFCLGLFPLIGKLSFLNGLPQTAVVWIVALGALYLCYAAIVEITNSNVIGWWSFAIGAIVLIVGFLPILHSFGIGPDFFSFSWISRTVYNILFILEGVFLMVATFAMEL
jgi:hypothetical protein